MAATQVGSVLFKITSNRNAFSKEMQKTANGVQSTFTNAMGTVGKAVGAALSVSAAVAFGKKCVQAASEAQAAWTGLSSILNGQGKSFSQANDFIQEYISDGLVPLNNAVTAYKNLAARGYNSDQIESTLTALKDAAAFGRQASYSYGDAIQSATEGLKNENSILVDNAGVTKNVAKMWDEYAKSIGTTASALTQQQKIQAEVSGIMQETKWQTGDAAEYTTTFAGKIAKLAATFTTLKTSIGNVVVPLLNMFMPAIQTAMDALVKFFNMLKAVMESLGWEMPTIEDLGGVSGLTDNAYAASAALTDIGDSATATSKKIKKAFAAYDEINVLNTGKYDSSSGAIGSAGTDLGNVSSGAVGAAKAPTALEEFNTEEIKDKLTEITAIVSISLLALGALLTFTGANIPLGIALLAAGAVGLATAIALNWNSMGSGIATVLDEIELVISGALLVIGALLTFSGANIPLGIALIASGAVGMATVLALNWNSTSNKCKESLAAITGIIGGALLAIGAVLTFSGANLPLGIALIAVGAAAIAASIALNWNSSESKIGNVINILTGVVGGALLVIGAMLTFSGANIPLGIALLAAGAITLASSIALNWSNVSDKTKNTIGIISMAVGAATLAVGALLTFTGANIPLGIALMASGVVGLASGVKAVNWEAIGTKVKQVFTKLKDSISSIMKSMITVVKTPINSIIGFINGLISGVTNGINSVIRALNKIQVDVPDWVPVLGGKQFGFNLKQVSARQIPYLAQGGWVAANNPQLAVVGDNTREGEIITPESKIREQVELALASFKGAAQNVKVQIELLIKYPDGRTVIKQINAAQRQEGRILIEV